MKGTSDLNSSKEQSSSKHSLDKVDQAYSAPPWWYDVRGFFILTFAYRSSIFRQIKLFGDNMKESHLESAVGTGTLMGFILLWRKMMRKPPIKIFAFDYARTMLDGARSRFKNEKYVTLFNADAAALPFADSSFDSANIANAFHCFPDPSGAVKELYRVLKPGAEVAVHVILPAEVPGFINWVSRSIIKWGQKKGLLKRGYTQQEVDDIFTQQGFQITYRHISGNTYDLKASK